MVILKEVAARLKSCRMLKKFGKRKMGESEGPQLGSVDPLGHLALTKKEGRRLQVAGTIYLHRLKET